MDYSKAIRILVGPEEKEYSVPECLLVEKSDFFRAACKKEWKEGLEHTVRLPETSPEALDLYLHWIYRNEVFIPAKDKKVTPPVSTSSIKSWIVGDKFGDTGLRNAAIDRLFNQYADDFHFPGPVGVTLAWDNASPESTLNRCILDFYATRLAKTNLIRDQWSLYPETFLQRLMIRALDGSKKCAEMSQSSEIDFIPPDRRPVSDFHEA